MNDLDFSSKGSLSALLDLIERRFDIRLETAPLTHLREVHQHYSEKREIMFMEDGSGSLSNPDYSKAWLIAEATRLMVLKEIDPRPRRKKKRKTK